MHGRCHLMGTGSRAACCQQGSVGFQPACDDGVLLFEDVAHVIQGVVLMHQLQVH